jgi:putative membrane protein
MMQWDRYGGHFGAGDWIGMAFMIVFWIAVVVAIVYLIRYLAARPHDDQRRETPANWLPPAAQTGSSALRILEERYAKGEIEQEEFLKRKADLTS